MNRYLAAVLVGLVGAAAGRADLIPPGTRNVPIDHAIETDKEYPDWVFLVVRGSGGVERAKLDPKTPLTIPGSSAVGQGPPPRAGEKEPLGLGYRSSTLAAVPKETAKGYATDKKLFAAVAGGKAAGLVRVKDAFPDHLNARADDPRKSVTRRFKVAKIDSKDGIVLEPVKADGGPGKEEEEAAAARPEFRWVAAGLGAAGLVGLAGLWLARLTRRAS